MKPPTPEWLDVKTLQWVCNFIDDIIRKKYERADCKTPGDRYDFRRKVSNLAYLYRCLNNRCGRIKRTKLRG